MGRVLDMRITDVGTGKASLLVDAKDYPVVFPTPPPLMKGMHRHPGAPFAHEHSPPHEEPNA